jgi:hypothetical protein
MRHVGEVCPPSTDSVRSLDSLSDVEVGRMMTVTQRVEHQHIEPTKLRERRLWNLVTISQIRKLPNPIPQNREGAVPHRHRDKRAVLKRERPANLTQAQLRQAAAFRCLGIEHISEHSADVTQCARVTLTRNRGTLSEIEDPNVIKAEYVVGVAVS